MCRFARNCLLLPCTLNPNGPFLNLNVSFKGCNYFIEMGESDLQANYNGNDEICGSETAKDLDLFQGPVQSLLKCGNVHDALDVYISAYSSDYPDSALLEIFVDGLVSNARENLTKSVTFNADYFLCMCGEVMTDPVTLKCGHTFSKKCVLSTMKTDCFDCKKCGKRHSRSSINQLKNNVTISALIEKFWKIQNTEKKHGEPYSIYYL